MTLSINVFFRIGDDIFHTYSTFGFWLQLPEPLHFLHFLPI